MSTPPPPEPLWRLLAAIPLAALRLWVGKLPPALVGILLTVCGLVLIVSPLALWIAWSPAVFNIVLGITGVALLAAITLVTLGRDEQL